MKIFIPLIFIIFIFGCNVNIEEEIIEKENLDTINEVGNMKLTSPAFEHNGKIPSEYTCDGEDVSPELNIEDVPEDVNSLVLIMDDPDAPVGNWDHWIVFNIAPDTAKIEKGTEPAGVGGKNSWKKTGYGGPCPPDREHRYFFKLYALDTTLDLAEGSTKDEIEKAMEGHIVEKTELIGLYERE